MRWPALVRGGFLLKALVAELRGIRLAMERQALALEALAAHLVPRLGPQATEEELADTGLSAFDAIEGGLVLDYITKTEADTGRTPTEREILSYLADEKTIDLHQRLKQRESLLHLERLQREEGRP